MTDYFKCSRCGKIVDEFQNVEFRFMIGKTIYRKKCKACAIKELERMRKRERLDFVLGLLAITFAVIAVYFFFGLMAR